MTENTKEDAPKISLNFPNNDFCFHHLHSSQN